MHCDYMTKKKLRLFHFSYKQNLLYLNPLLVIKFKINFSLGDSSGQGNHNVHLSVE